MLRHAVVRLLPFLLYGQTSLARVLASHIVEAVDWTNLAALAEQELEPPSEVRFAQGLLLLLSQLSSYVKFLILPFEIHTIRIHCISRFNHPVKSSD